MKVLKPYVMLWGLLAGLWAAGPACAGEKILIMTSGIEKLIYLPARLAEQLGYFRDEGLDLELQTASAGVQAEDALLVGAAQGVIGAYDHTITLQAKGKAVQSVIQFTRSPGEVVLVAPDQQARIKSPADFRSRRLGVTALGASTSHLMQYLALTRGVQWGEYRLVPVGSDQQFQAALRERRIDVGITTEPTASRLLLAQQAQVLIDLRTPEATAAHLGGPYPFACLYMQTAWIQKNRGSVQKIVNALARALHYIDTHSASDIAEKMPPEYHAGDKPLYVQALAQSKSMFIPDGLMPAQGPATVLHLLASVNKTVRGKPVDLEQTYTSDFVKVFLAAGKPR